MAKAKQGAAPITALPVAAPRNTTPTRMDELVEVIKDNKAEKNDDGTIKEVMVPLKLIRREEGFDVRVDSRNPEKIDEFAGQFKEDPTRIPPIFLEYREDANGEMYFINCEGRHREDGANKAGKTDICAIIFYDLTFQERRILALYGNMGGPLPMSQRDYKKVVLELLQKECVKRPTDKMLFKTSKNGIRATLVGKLAKDEIEGIIKWAARDYNNLLLNCALGDVRKGDMTLKEAAKKWGVPFGRLQKKHTKESGSKGRADDPTKIGGHIGTEFKRFRKLLDGWVGDLIEQKEKGIFETEDVSGFFQQMRRLTGDLTDRIKEGEMKLRALQYGD